MVDPSSVQFRDRAREKQRLGVLRKRNEARPDAEPDARPAGPPGGALAGGAGTGGSERRAPAAKRRKHEARDEAAELDAEYRLLTKLRRGKISEREFDVATGLAAAAADSDDDETEGGAGGGEDVSAPPSRKRRKAFK